MYMRVCDMCVHIRIASVCQLVEVDYAIGGVFVDEQTYHVGAYETGSSRYQYISLRHHISFIYISNIAMSGKFSIG